MLLKEQVRAAARCDPPGPVAAPLSHSAAQIPMIHPLLYKRWRASGQAFELRECAYIATNPTLLSHRDAVEASEPGLAWLSAHRPPCANER
jgi:hypothetical protein